VTDRVADDDRDGQKLDVQPIDRHRARFVTVVRLNKEEVFAACQALADADRCLVRTGHHREANALGDLFERFESRLTTADAYSVTLSDRCSGWNSSESELTQ
jgi:hypothetical protein